MELGLLMDSLAKNQTIVIISEVIDFYNTSKCPSYAIWKASCFILEVSYNRFTCIQNFLLTYIEASV